MAGIQNPDTIVFDAPIEFVDNRPLPANSVLKYQIGFGRQAGNYTILADDTDLTVTGGKQTFALTVPLDFGQWYTAVRVVLTTAAGGQSSQWSDSVPFEIISNEPKAPTNITVIITGGQPQNPPPSSPPPTEDPPPTTPPTSTDDVTTLSIEGSGTEFVTMASSFRRGTVPSGTVPVITNNANVPVTGCHTTVLSTFPDGSVKHARLHGQVVGGTTYKIRRGTNPTGTNLTIASFLSTVTGPLCRVVLSGPVAGVGAVGTADLRDLLSSPSNRAVMTQNATQNLRIVEQGTNVLTVRVAQNIGTHLRVNFEVKWHGGQEFWVDAWVHNGYGTIAGQNSAQYTGVIEVNGVAVGNPEVFNATRPHYNKTIWHCTRPNGVWSGQSGSLYVKHNTQYIQDSLAVPNYRRTQVPTAAHMNAIPKTCAPMDNCEIRDNLDGGGAGAELALLPRWDANYLKSGADKRCFDNLLANTDGFAAYSVFFLNGNNGEYMEENTFPNASFNQEIGYASGAFTGLSPFPYTSVNSHLPCAGYTAYLITGNQYHLDIMNGWTTLANMWNSTNRNFTFEGKTYRQHYEPSIRAMGWQYRSNGVAGYINPDNHFLKPYFNGWVNGTATVIDNPHYGPGGDRRNVLGALAEFDVGVVNYALFFHMFFHQAVSFLALDLGFTSLLPTARYASILIAGLFGNTGEFPFELAPRDRIKLGTSGPAAVGTVYGSFSEVRTQNNIGAGESGTVDIIRIADAFDGFTPTGVRNRVLRQTSNDSYFANILPCLGYLHRLGIEGGFECYVRSQLCPLQADYSNVGQFDIGMREVDLPAYIQNAAEMTWTQIPNTSLPVPANYPGTPSARVLAWGGMSVKWLNSEVRILAGGGHGDASGNSVEGIRLNAATPTWVIERQPSTPTPLNGPYFADGKPNSRHIYYDQKVHQGRGLHIAHGASFVATNASAHPTVDAYDPVARDWLPSTTFANSPGSAGAGMKAYNLSNGCIYFLSAGDNNMAFRRWSINSGTSTIVANLFEFGQIYKAGACDPIRGVVLHTPGSEENVWKSYSIDTGARTNRTPNTTAGLTATQQANLLRTQVSLEWDVRGKRYLHFADNAQNVIAIDPVTFTATALPVQGTPPPATQGTGGVGILSRAQYVPELDIFVVYPNHNTNMFFFKFGRGQRPI